MKHTPEIIKIIEKRITQLDAQIEVAKKEDIYDITEFGLKHRKQELRDLLTNIKENS